MNDLLVKILLQCVCSVHVRQMVFVIVAITDYVAVVDCLVAAVVFYYILLLLPL